MNKNFQTAGGNRNAVEHRDWTRDVRARILNKLRDREDITDLMKDYRQYRMRSVSVQAAKIVQVLHSLGAARVSELATKCRITPHIVSAQLGRLVEAGLVCADAERRYRIADPILDSALVLLDAPKDWQPPTESQLIESLRVDYPGFQGGGVAARRI